ncbi:MAG: hypothetical protein NVSMB57_09880 [Actinomycetota bacterium]
MKRHVAMNSAEPSTKYLGAMIPGAEQRLVLVPLDPAEPWAAFKRMRTWMKDSRTTESASVSLFESPASLAPEAKVIPLRRKTS